MNRCVANADSYRQICYSKPKHSELQNLSHWPMTILTIEIRYIALKAEQSDCIVLC